MDPNANIEEQARIAAAIVEAHDAGQRPQQCDVDRLAELVLALDGWLRSGGFLPKAWRVDPGAGEPAGTSLRLQYAAEPLAPGQLHYVEPPTTWERLDDLTARVVRLEELTEPGRGMR
jgi:hypothetical protein